MEEIMCADQNTSTPEQRYKHTLMPKLEKLFESMLDYDDPESTKMHMAHIKGVLSGSLQTDCSPTFLRNTTHQMLANCLKRTSRNLKDTYGLRKHIETQHLGGEYCQRFLSYVDRFAYVVKKLCECLYYVEKPGDFWNDMKKLFVQQCFKLHLPGMLPLLKRPGVDKSVQENLLHRLYQFNPKLRDKAPELYPNNLENAYHVPVHGYHPLMDRERRAKKARLAEINNKTHISISYKKRIEHLGTSPYKPHSVSHQNYLRTQDRSHSLSNSFWNHQAQPQRVKFPLNGGSFKQQRSSESQSHDQIEQKANQGHRFNTSESVTQPRQLQAVNTPQTMQSHSINTANQKGTTNQSEKPSQRNMQQYRHQSQMISKCLPNDWSRQIYVSHAGFSEEISPNLDLPCYATSEGDSVPLKSFPELKDFIPKPTSQQEGSAHDQQFRDIISDRQPKPLGNQVTASFPGAQSIASSYSDPNSSVLKDAGS